jgi:hypothetical protein
MNGSPVANRVRAWKSDPAGLTVPVFDPNREHVGNLRLIGTALAADPELAADMARWRDGAKAHFLTRFPIDVSGTANWLRSVVVGDDTRLLFLIEDQSGRRVGHLGVRDLVGTACELDNLLRGEPGGHPRLMPLAEIGLLDWLGRALNVRTVTLAIISHNYHALALHEWVGFRRVRAERLNYVGDAESGQYVVDPAPPGASPDPDAFELIGMELQMDEFRQSHPWLSESSPPS